ncbi:MAG: hypothetical protein ACK55I_48415, partial [bacterium]
AATRRGPPCSTAIHRWYRMCRAWQLRKPCRRKRWQGKDGGAGGRGRPCGRSAAPRGVPRPVDEGHAEEVARPADVDGVVRHRRVGVERHLPLEELLAGQDLEAVRQGVDEDDLPGGGEHEHAVGTGHERGMPLERPIGLG